MSLSEYKYSFEPLTEYFKQLNKSVKEVTMFKDKLAYWKEKISSLWTKPVEFVDNEKQEAVELDGSDDFWSFEMRTGPWSNNGEIVPTNHTVIVDVHDSTWMDVLDKILDAMQAHYGYSIKEQVYYSVRFPYNEINNLGEPESGYGRSLNDERLQLLLLAHPELYEVGEAK
jgi:hypothetical protein